MYTKQPEMTHPVHALLEPPNLVTLHTVHRETLNTYNPTSPLQQFPIYFFRLLKHCKRKSHSTEKVTSTPSTSFLFPHSQIPTILAVLVQTADFRIKVRKVFGLHPHASYALSTLL